MVVITISDIGAWSRYELDGGTLRMVHMGGCCDALAENHCNISESLSDETIADRVYDSWVIGYDGDPEELGLKIKVDRE